MKPESLLRPLRRTQHLSLGCAALDRFFHGGIPIGTVTELVSESGCGKTQLCLQLSLSAPTIYLHSEFPFPLRRLVQLLKPGSETPLDRILIKPIYSADQLFDVLLKLGPVLLNPPNLSRIKLIVVDSIATLFRSEFDNTGSDLKRRASLFFKISGSLRALASKYDVAVVVTNQVMDVMDSFEGVNYLRVGNLGHLSSSGREVSPALGISWANCVNMRIFLSRDEVAVRVEDSSGNVDNGGDEIVRTRTKRQLHVLFSPYLPESSCEYAILREGVFGCNS